MGKKNSDSPIKAFNRYLKKRFSLAIQQRIFLLLKREEEKIKRFRADWKIPENGFATLEEGKHWQDHLNEIAPEKVRDVEYLEFENFYLLDKYTPKGLSLSIDFEEYPRLTKIQNNANAVFEQELKKLLVQLKIDQELLLVMKDYMVLGGGSPGAVKDTGIMVSERFTVVPGFGELERKIALTFGPNTDGPDLRDIYKHLVSNLQHFIPGDIKGKAKLQKKFRLNLEVAKHWRPGITAKEMTEALEQKGIIKDIREIEKILKAIESY